MMEDGIVTFSRQIRARPVMDPERRIDSNIAARRGFQGLAVFDGEGEEE